MIIVKFVIKEDFLLNVWNNLIYGAKKIYYNQSKFWNYELNNINSKINIDSRNIFKCTSKKY